MKRNSHRQPRDKRGETGEGNEKGGLKGKKEQINGRERQCKK